MLTREVELDATAWPTGVETRLLFALELGVCMSNNSNPLSRFLSIDSFRGKVFRAAIGTADLWKLTGSVSSSQPSTFSALDVPALLCCINAAFDTGALGLVDDGDGLIEAARISFTPND